MAYDHSVISSILSLEEAKTRLNSKDMTGFLKHFRTKATDSGLNNQYGVTLVHRHTNVKPGFRLFDFKQTLQAFPLSNEAEDLHGAEIRPKSLAWRKGSWMPYEFEIGSSDKIRSDFLAAIVELLETFGLNEVIGPRRYCPSDEEELEITDRGGISVKIPWNHVRAMNRLTLVGWS